MAQTDIQEGLTLALDRPFHFRRNRRQRRHPKGGRVRSQHRAAAGAGHARLCRHAGTRSGRRLCCTACLDCPRTLAIPGTVIPECASATTPMTFQRALVKPRASAMPSPSDTNRPFSRKRDRTRSRKSLRFGECAMTASWVQISRKGSMLSLRSGAVNLTTWKSSCTPSSNVTRRTLQNTPALLVLIVIIAAEG